jgi:L-iditol 2-dehydrogenase
MRTMAAVVKHGDGAAGVSLRQVPVPEPGTGQARVRVVAAGVCGTDLHLVDDEYAHERPVVMGHEVAGVVDAAPSAPEWVGRRVALETYFSTCRECAWCRGGRPNLCPSRRSIGSFADGGFADYVVVPVRNLHSLPAHVGDIEGALVEPLACVVHCLLDPPRVQAGDAVLVTGPGTMGQLTARLCTALGATVTITGLRRDADRLAVAAAHGAEMVTADVPPDEFDVVVEASGSAPGLATALAAVRRGGHLVQMGIMGRPVEVGMDTLFSKELTVSTGFASTPASWRRAIRMLEDRTVTLDGLVTVSHPLTCWADALTGVRAGAGLKTVLVPTTGGSTAPRA